MSDLSATGQSTDVPQVAVDSDGDAVAVWRRFNGSNYIVQSAVRPAGGAWSAVSDLSATGRTSWAPQVAVDSDGDAVAVWSHWNGSHQSVQSAVRPAGGSWSAASDLSATGQNAFDPQVAVDSDGDAVAVWFRADGSHQIVQSAARPAGGSWNAVSDLSATGQNAFDPQVAVDSDGDAVAVWRGFNGSNYVVQSAVQPAGGAWSAVSDLSATGQDTAVPQVAVDSDGDAVAVWSHWNGSHQNVQSAVRPAGGSWSTVSDLSATGQDAFEPQVAVDSDGDAVAVWSRFNGSHYIVQSAARPAGGAWSAVSDLSATGQNTASPQVAVDSDGDAVAVWLRFDGSNAIVQSAVLGFDATPPSAVDDAYTHYGSDTPLSVAAADGVLANDTDADGDLLTASLVSGPTNGTLTLNADGSFSYQPDADYVGQDSFTYEANDGTADSNVATVTITVGAGCSGEQATIVGTAAKNVLDGTSGDDVIAGLGGDDKLLGKGGDDTLCGGDGKDELNAGAGDDYADGGAGNDTVRGDVGNDALLGGSGADSLLGDAGDDSLSGGPGSPDTCKGDTGTDTLAADHGCERISGVP